MPRQQPIDKEEFLYIILAVGFLCLFGFGWYGFVVLRDHGLFTSFYLTLQLLVLNGPGIEFDNFPWQIKVAAIGLPVFTIVTVIFTVFRVIGLQSNLIWLKLRPRKHVFLGIGKVPAGIIDTFKDNKGFSAVAVDINTEHRRAVVIKKTKKVMTLQHDTDDANFLAKLKLDKAEYIYCFTGDDIRNINIARKVIDIIQRKSAKKYPKIFINVESKALLETVSRESVFKNFQKQGQGEINWFSSNQQSALALIQKYPPRFELAADEATNSGNLHIGIVGQPPCLDEFILNLVKQCAMLPKGKFLLSIFGASEARFQTFLNDYLMLSSKRAKGAFGGYLDHVELKFFPISTQGVDAHTLQQAFEAQERSSFDTFYVLGDSDYDTMSSALRLKQMAIALSDTTELYFPLQPDAQSYDARNAATYSPRIVIRLPGDQRPSCPDEEDTWESLRDADWFHGVRDIFVIKSELYPSETIERVAKYINAAFDTADTNSESESAPDDFREQVRDQFSQENIHLTTAKWSELDEFGKMSSIQSAENVFIKLRKLGFALELRTENDKPDPDVLKNVLNKMRDAITKHTNTLKELEHQRFVLERVMDGWLLTPTWANELLALERALFVRERAKDGGLLTHAWANELLSKNTKLKKSLKQFRLNETLIAYEKLSEFEKNKDQLIVDVIPLIIEDEVIAERFTLKEISQ